MIDGIYTGVLDRIMDGETALSRQLDTLFRRLERDVIP